VVLTAADARAVPGCGSCRGECGGGLPGTVLSFLVFQVFLLALRGCGSFAGGPDRCGLASRAPPRLLPR
jgi:hypothetical protein